MIPTKTIIRSGKRKRTGSLMTEMTLLWPYIIALGLCVALFVVPEKKPQRKRQTGDYIIYWPEETK
jgi:hypothetical protein